MSAEIYCLHFCRKVFPFDSSETSGSFIFYYINNMIIFVTVLPELFKVLMLSILEKNTFVKKIAVEISSFSSESIKF
jgi:hypothetical protein